MSDVIHNTFTLFIISILHREERDAFHFYNNIIIFSEKCLLSLSLFLMLVFSLSFSTKRPKKEAENCSAYLCRHSAVSIKPYIIITMYFIFYYIKSYCVTLFMYHQNPKSKTIQNVLCQPINCFEFSNRIEREKIRNKV